jgi:NAD(P)-dependent dehydrogenase (short-subunit alcohol dehydrogenase family)
VQITRQMAIDFAVDGNRVNAVCPGTVDTPLLRKAAADSGDPETFAHPAAEAVDGQQLIRRLEPLDRLPSADAPD